MPTKKTIANPSARGARKNSSSKRTPRTGGDSIEQSAKLAALDRVQAIIEFALDGTILTANQNFLDLMGYTLEEIRGRHHRIFADANYTASAEYTAFWRRLNEGSFESGEFRRLGKAGKEVWILASYNPLLDANGKPFKVVKFATDVTAQKLRNADFAGQISAIHKAQAVIEFDITGKVLDANDNFLNALGYRREEVIGKQHSMFVEPAYAESQHYKKFWSQLAAGQYDAGEYKRIGKNGREVWIQASYNPILDLNGRPFKVVKYATDVTQQKLENADFAGQIQAIGKAQAVIEFGLDGVVKSANDNFLAALGYQRDEIIGKHHSMFVERSYAASEAYREFWRRLNAGQYDAGEYKRIGKSGRDVWIQASYNPILDLNGKPFKIVKYATDITEQKLAFMELKRVIQSLSEGDLTAQVQGNLKGDFATLRDQLNGSFVTLSDLIRQISDAAYTINSAAQDVSEGSSNLNQRTQEQSSALEQTASSLEELTATVRQNAHSANHARDLATTARDAAEHGGRVVNDAVDAMGAITQSSARVADIIGVIEQIAFQTNMLALNAAVEAARAGDQGRGFAVVASEVRNLAQRSASAAKEIRSLILDSHEKVQQGEKLVNDSGATLGAIVDAVKQVTDIIAEIDAASSQQATGLDQINTAVTHMDKNTQQNAAMVEQATAAAESMQEQTRNLAEIVRTFKIKEEADEPGEHANGSRSRNGVSRSAREHARA